MTGLTAPQAIETHVEPAVLKGRPLRIGMVTHYMPPHIGGIEVVGQSLFEAYRAAGYEVNWIASRVPDDAPLREDGRIRVGCVNVAERSLGVPWPIWGPAGVARLSRLIEWADVIHVHDCLYLGSAMAVLFSSRSQKPVIVSQHIGFGRYSSRLLNKIQLVAYHTIGRAVLRRATRLVFCTSAAEEFITELMDGRPLNASTVPIGIDTDKFRPASERENSEARVALGIRGSNPVALFVGRLEEKKGAALFLQLSALLPNHCFVVVGDGSIRPPAADNLIWIPYVEPESMPAIYHAADAFVLPSYSEGFPLSVLEAMASGVPVIVPKGETFTELLEEERCSVASEREPGALGRALSGLLEKPTERGIIAQRARELVVERWSANRMRQYYTSLVSSLGNPNQ